MLYLGWQIWAYETDSSLPLRKKLTNEIKTLFQDGPWALLEYNDSIQLTHTDTQHEVKVEIHGEELSVKTSEWEETVWYALTAKSISSFWKGNEREHRHLLFDVFQRLPWSKAAAFNIDGKIRLIHFGHRIPIAEQEEYSAKSSRLENSLVDGKHRHRRIIPLPKRRI